MARSRCVAYALLVVVIVALRVGALVGSPGGVPWWVWILEFALGAAIYVGGVFAFTAPVIAFDFAREAYRAHRAAPLSRAAKRNFIVVCVGCLTFSAVYVGLMARYHDELQPSMRYRMAHGGER